MAARPIVHVEIPSKDPETTAGFYGELFGWTFELGSEPLNYTMFQTGNLSGGYPEIGEYYKSGEVLIYIASDDLNADLERIQAAGGTILSPIHEVPGNGWLAMFSDPAGNRVALWKAAPR